MPLLRKASSPVSFTPYVSSFILPSEGRNLSFSSAVSGERSHKAFLGITLGGPADEGPEAQTSGLTQCVNLQQGDLYIGIGFRRWQERGEPSLLFLSTGFCPGFSPVGLPSSPPFQIFPFFRALPLSYLQEAAQHQACPVFSFSEDFSFYLNILLFDHLESVCAFIHFLTHSINIY